MYDKKERKSPNYLSDVLEAVDMMDSKKRMKEDFSKEHARAVKSILLANAVNGKGYISISKARQLLQQRYSTSKASLDKSKGR